MGPLDSAMTGTLETLADLREDGRRRFIKRRTEDELEEILVAILQEQDEKKNEEGRAPLHGPAPIQTPVVKPDEVMADANNEDLTSYKKSLWDQIDSRDNSEDDCCTSTRTSAMGGRKLGNSVETKTGTANSSQFETTHGVQKGMAHKTTMSEQPATPQSKITKMQNKTPDHIKDTKPPPSSSDRHNKPLSVVLHVPGNYNDVHYPDFDQLPLATHSELKRRLEKHLTGSAHKTYAFQRLNKNPGFYEDRPYCIYDQIRHGLGNKEFGKPIKPQAFAQGGRLGLRADDRCIKDGVPCTHILNLNGEYVLCIVPLPKDAQRSVNWKELGFWVVE